ncbi:uncharacterized protein LOC133315311 isoform X2 [Gastrolobium bilobum]|uniref:uncharacterized protein LOC133315311 isoform X2 n=1 Tax=Gastrolobium bilobum TaxID=150636 RepID=UPI002AB1F588|nr:uncharacterized protein LOC133315311 isoform X2 [Gastrolobium bilobum]
MDSLVSLTPKLRSFNCQPLSTSTNLSLSRRTCYSYKTPPPPSKSNLKDSERNPIRKVAALRSQKWVSDGGVCYLQNGGWGTALLSVTVNAKLRISPFVATLAGNPTFVSGLLAWFIAQSIKVFLNFFVDRKWDLRLLFASGGMPSSHSALCTALTTSVALCHGVADSLFPVCLGFSLIVMYDAIGVRRHAGMQAEDVESPKLRLLETIPLELAWFCYTTKSSRVSPFIGCSCA